MEQTITQSGALFRVHQSRRHDLRIALRFYNKRLRQLGREARRERIKLIWLKLRRFFS